MTKLLVNFLRGQNAIDKYIDNFDYEYAEVNSMYESNNYIEGAFEWDGTPEGRSYWWEIDNTWKAITDSIEDINQLCDKPIFDTNEELDIYKIRRWN